MSVELGAQAAAFALLAAAAVWAWVIVLRPGRAWSAWKRFKRRRPRDD